jgi:hypothetical protein
MKGRAGTAWHAGLIGLCLWACINDRSSAFLLESLLPAQRAVFTALMPDFLIRSFGVQLRGGHLRLRAVTETRHYLVAGGRAHPPGIGFDVETPARAALLHGLLIVAGALLTAPRAGRAQAVAVLLSLPSAALMAVLSLPLILAGEHWGLAVNAGGEPTLRAALVATSGFLLHGGAYALCAATVWALAAFSRRSEAQRGRRFPRSRSSPASIIPRAAGSGTALRMKSKP